MLKIGIAASPSVDELLAEGEGKHEDHGSEI